MARPSDGGGDGHRHQAEDQQLLAPLAAEQPPRPAQHRPSSRSGPCAAVAHGRGRGPGSSNDSGPSGVPRLVDDAPVAQEHDPVGPRRQLGLVRHDHAGHAARADLAQQAHHGLAVDRVERAGRLVGQQQPAVADHGAGDGHPLTLAAGELVREVVGAVGDAEFLQRARAWSRASRADRAVELERQRDVLDRGQAGEQVEVLEDEADRAAPQPRLVVARHARQRRAADEDLAAGRVLEAAGDRQQTCSCPTRSAP